MKLLATSACAIALTSPFTAPAHADAPPSYGHDFVTIGSPGNPAFPDDPNDWRDRRVAGHGAVNHTYRIARTEITTAQWLEFAQAFEPFTDWRDNSKDWLAFGDNVSWGGESRIDYATDQLRFSLRDRPTAAQEPVRMGWYEAVFYCNWLHNDKEVSIDALLTGAYDTTTIRDGDWGNEEYRRLPDAKYWIPSIDEWLKAGFWDPNKDERDGWWLYPDASDTLPVAGSPEEGGETNRGLYQMTVPPAPYPPVGSYPHVTSPWGLLDVSGGVEELAWQILPSSGPLVVGSDFRTDEPDPPPYIGSRDIIWQPGLGGTVGSSGRHALRIASQVPAPGTAMIIVACGVCVTSKRPRVAS